MSDFQTQVNVQPAPAVVGDFASANPRATVLAGPGSLVAGLLGVTVGRFAWAASTGANDINSGETDAYNIANSFGTGLPAGFVHRNNNALITAFLQGSSLVIPQGMPVVLHSAGDFWVKNEGAGACTAGMKAYADYSTGKITFASTGTPPTGATATGATLQKIVSNTTSGALPTTNTSTGSIAGTTLTVTAVGAGCVLGAGQVISGTGILTGTTIIGQLTGTAGSTGTYQVSVAQTVTGTTVTMSGGGLTLTGANTTGVFAIGMTISGTNIPAGTTITGYGTATAGGAGTYTVDRVAATAATASTITAANAMFLTVDATSSGTWALNDLLSGAGVGANQSIAATGATNANLTGLGGAGTYLTNAYQGSALTAQTISVYSGVETKWVAGSNGAAGELVKMTSWLLG